MKRNTLVIVVLAVLTLLVGIAGFAYSDGNSAPAKSSATTCPKFMDNNKDGICDNTAQCHKDGKCMNGAQCQKDGKCQGSCTNCPNFKDANKDGKCDMTNCTKHQAAACPGHAGGGCQHNGAGCPNHR